ncbi:MAG: UvrD-helicase domain-containing protein [Flavobacteriales bacterium]
MNSLENFITYKSSAGSGKTYTLVKEFLQIVFQSDNPTRYRNILAITFTNKAANEMKERVIENLRELTKEQDNDLIIDYEKAFGINKKILREKAKKVLQSILHNYSDLKISTIDKFTYKIIRAFSKDLNLSSDFEIEMDKDKILTEAIDLIISKAGEDERLSKILLEFLNSQIENEKDWRIEKSIFDFSKELTNEESEPFLERLKEVSDEDFEKIRKFITSELKKEEETIVEKAKKVLDLFEKNGLTVANFSRGTIFNYFLAILNGEIDKLLKTTDTLEKAINENVWLPKSASVDTVSRMESINEEVRSLYFDIIDSSKKYFFYDLLNENAFNIILIKELYEAINKIKEEQNILLISDFNKLISEEIKNQPAPFIYEKIGERYKNIMIDEFQDTSVLQWHNLLPLIDNSLSIGEKTLLVGDAKQAIYRFRGGKVEQFVELPNIIDKSDDIFLEEREITLRNNHKDEFLETNWRSHSQVIEFNNWFFDELKSFLEEDKQKIYDKQKQKTTNKNEGYVEVTFLPYDKDEIEDLYLEKTKEKVDECLEDGFEMKDIAILVSKNKYGKLLSNYLVEENYKVLTSESLLIEEDKEVNFVINFLKFIHNNNENSAKLEMIKYFFEDEKYSPALLSYSKKVKNKANINIKELLMKLNPKFDLVKLFELSLYDLAETIMRQFIEDSKEGNSFLIKLLDVIYSFTLKNNDLQSFLTYWENNSWRISLETPEDNAITIMTVHKSKGLQFPVVISSFTNWEFHSSMNIPKKWVEMDGKVPHLPIGILPLKSKILGTDFAYLKEIEDEHVKLDKFNQLYVALTRPEKRLYVISDDAVRTKKEFKTNNIHPFLYRICLTHENFNENELILGERIKEPKKEKVKSADSNLEIKTVISTNWREKIRISQQYNEIWGEEGYKERIAYGNLIHNILAKIETKEDIEPAILDFAEQGLITNNEVEALGKEIAEILEVNEVKPWFSGTGKIMNEKDILSKEGKLYRPDKVILFPNKTVVVDFKTGEKQEKYANQITNYANLLSEMNYPNIEKYLLYTKDKSVEQISL